MFYCPLRSLSARSFGERIRDKIAASKQKGMWMGGVPPLGYQAQDRKLDAHDDGRRAADRWPQTNSC